MSFGEPDLKGKTCSKCGIEKPASEFYERKSGPSVGKLRSQCKLCEKHSHAQWCSDNRDKINDYERLNRKLFPDKVRARNKQRDLTNLLVWRKNNYQKNRLKVRAQQKAYRKSHPPSVEVLTRAAQLRRARKNAAPGTYSCEEWRDLVKLYDHTCLRCGKSEPEIKLSVDHIVPLSKGGSNYIENIQCLCLPCNCSKRDKIIDYRIDWWLNGGAVAA